MQGLLHQRENVNKDLASVSDDMQWRIVIWQYARDFASIAALRRACAELASMAEWLAVRRLTGSDAEDVIAAKLRFC